MRDPEIPPPLEMICLSALWHLEEGNVEEVRRTARSERPLAYTTVLTLLERLSRRGAVTRRKDGRGYRYRAAVERKSVQTRAVGHFVGCYFDGSAEELRRFLALAVHST